MSLTPCNDRGITLIESVIAILIVSIGLMGLLSMQPSALQTSVRTDYLGRAAVVLSKELADQELAVMNPCNFVALAPSTVSAVVNASSQDAAQQGDILFTVRRDTTPIGTNLWLVTIRVSWPPLNTTGIQESIVVTRQANFKSGC